MGCAVAGWSFETLAKVNENWWTVYIYIYSETMLTLSSFLGLWTFMNLNIDAKYIWQAQRCVGSYINQPKFGKSVEFICMYDYVTTHNNL